MNPWPNNFYKPWEFLPWLGPWPVLDLKTIITGDDVCGIYVLINNVNGSMYIGQSIHIKERITDHRARRNKMSGCKTICLALKKYGLENFSFGVLELCLEDDLDKSEVKWIKHLKPRYNRNGGGAGNNNRHVPEHVRNIISLKCRAAWDRKTEEQKRRVIDKQLCRPRKGHSVSEEARAKISLKLTGRKMSEERRKQHSEALRKHYKDNPKKKRKWIYETRPTTDTDTNNGPTTIPSGSTEQVERAVNRRDGGEAEVSSRGEICDSLQQATFNLTS